jgi:hypothetical protein
MSLAKKYSRRNLQRNYNRRPEWEQNNYSDDYRLDRNNDRHRFQNRDYDDRNFWSYDDNYENFSDDNENFVEDDFMSEEYGVDRFSRAVPSRRRFLGNNDMNSGYRRRMNNQPNPYYSDKYYYNQNDNQDNYIYEDVSNRQYGYDYYESYPSYGQVSEEERRFRRSNEFPQSEFDRRQGERGLRRRGQRPNIRDKRY